MAATAICRECGCRHSNKSEASQYQELAETCWSCTHILITLSRFVMASNAYQPIKGGPRKLTITGYKIERV